MNPTRLERILDCASSKRIMVIGDLMLDEFVWGKVGRVDREQFTSPSAMQIEEVVAAVRKNVSATNAVVFEDYGKGFLTTELVSQITHEVRSAGKIISADPNPRHLVDWRGVTAVKPNRAEAFLAAGVPWREPDDASAEDVDLKRAGEVLLKKWETKYVLVTLGEHGMMLFQEKEAP